MHFFQMVKEEAPAVCGNMWQRCEALRTLNKHLQLAQAVSVSGQHTDPLPILTVFM